MVWAFHSAPASCYGRAVPTLINPDTLATPRGYSNGVVLTGGRILFIAGQVGWDRDGQFVSDDFAEQFAQALANVVAVLREAGGEPEHIGRITLYVTDKRLYQRAGKAIGAAWREHLGKTYPAVALLEVQALLEDRALVEIEVTAVLP